MLQHNLITGAALLLATAATPFRFLQRIRGGRELVCQLPVTTSPSNRDERIPIRLDVGTPLNLPAGGERNRAAFDKDDVGGRELMRFGNG
jgi:hypothetical protein